MFEQYSLLQVVFVTLVGIAIAAWIINDARTPSVNIGFSQGTGRATAHGAVFVKDGEKLTPIYFTVDKPEQLQEPSWINIRAIFDQTEKLGMTPVSVELFCSNNHLVYYRHSSSPVLVQPA